MKKILILFILLTSNVYADAIPGLLELDVSLKSWMATGEFSESYYNTEIGFKYGVSHDWFQPYLFGKTLTYFEAEDNLYSNNPFYSDYTVGIGMLFKKIFYIEAGHTCSHRVFSNTENNYGLNKSMTRYQHNHIKVGIKFNID